MDVEPRRAVVTALSELATSADFRDRADAGRALASFADLPEAAETLLRLVLDAGDTYVTRVTAEALLRRHDSTGVAVVARALDTADDDQVTWIAAAVHDVHGIFAVDRDAAVRTCADLATEHHHPGLDELTELLGDLDPVLRPDQPG